MRFDFELQTWPSVPMNRSLGGGVVPGVWVAGGLCRPGTSDGPLRAGAAGGRVCQEPAEGGGVTCQLGRPAAGQRATETRHRPYLSGAGEPQDDSQGKLLPSLKTS